MTTPPSLSALVPAGGFDDVEKRLRERKHTVNHDAYLPKDALQPLGMHNNGEQFYYSRLDAEGADAIHTLGLALASQIEITNTERALAESLTKKLATLPATQSGLCPDCENKKLREVMSAPRPDVSFGEAIERLKFVVGRAPSSRDSVSGLDWLNACAHHDAPCGDFIRKHGESILSALRAQSPAEGGFVLVPREPTYEQLEYGSRVLMDLPEMNARHEYRDQAQAIYAAMLAATPTAIALRESQAEGKGE